MANKTKNTGNGNTPANDPSKKKQAFDQGTGDNDSRNDSKANKMNDAKGNETEMRQGKESDMGNQNPERSERGDETKVTNVDRKVTNYGQNPGTNDTRHLPTDEDADMGPNNSNTRDQKTDPEIDTPNVMPEKTEKKLPEM